MSSRRWRLPPAGLVYTALVMLFLFAPMILVVIFSFDARGRGTFPLSGLTLSWYRELFDDPVMTAAALNSVIVAAIAALITTVIGTLASFALIRSGVRVAGAFTGLIALPIVIPPLLVGIAMLSFFSKLGIGPSLGTVVVAHVVLTLPFFVLILNASLASFDRSLEEAATTLGAGPWQRLRHITLPLIRPSLIGAALLVVALSLTEFIVTFFTIGHDATLPVVIWGQMRAGISPVVNAVSTLMLLVTTVMVVGVRLFARLRFSP